jgi:hypothetical protein
MVSREETSIGDFSATQCEIPCVVKFDDRPHLDKLIEALTETFAVRYEKPLSDDHIHGA